ncbi:TPA: hypothetical protein SLH18_004027 [Citrobacter freundii]|uniref:hypothetical protein n=1 Tax=Enterobacter cloacae complex TaxID=354276 RepID=UPI001012F03C|nr:MULTISPECIES: hypothetical protein [Enterobacter cloacae complex]MDQ6581688.1 hypothetical protein [Enterobacter hormaechei]RYA38825.1 hypothetical protein DD605_18700 [Enterobacter cloacae complex sp. 3DZ3S2B]RYA42929.1 hypothetical protein DD603_07585 [Enterobacter cloacae complex sp. 2DZ2F2B]HEI8964003.1 hypothetical protein [Citrobacter freundii]
MIHVYEPSIEAPTDKSPDWYKNYHNIFNICHLTNVLLLSYMKSYIQRFEYDVFLEENKEFLIKEGKLIEKDFLGKVVTVVNDEDVFNLAVKSFLEEIIQNNVLRAGEIKNHYSVMGVNVGEYFQKNVNVNLNELLKSLPTDNWYLVVTGFLNVWEFMFLFSTIESNLKEILNSRGVQGRLYTNELIQKIGDEYPDVLESMREVHHFSKDVSLDIWILYTEIRNIYAHTHGILNDKNIRDLKKKIKYFRRSYRKSFKEINSVSDLIFSDLVNEADELFESSTLISGKFYLIPDNELNIFRNFTSKFMTLLSYSDK